MQQLSPMDASFVYMETPSTPMHIGSLAIYDPSTSPNGKLRFKEVLEFIEGRLDGAWAFRRRLVRVPFDLDHPYWIEDPDFDLEYHVRHVALPEPGDWRQLCILAARLHSRALDLTKPLWEFTVIEGLDNIEGLQKAVSQSFPKSIMPPLTGCPAWRSQRPYMTSLPTCRNAHLT